MRRLLLLSMITFLPGLAVCAHADPNQASPDTIRAEPKTEPHPLGRLFFSPEDRAILDRFRQQNSGNTVTSTTAQITVNGIVRRNNGKTTVWINQIPQRENEKQGVTVLKSAAKSPTVPLQLPSGKQILLKPGQTFDTAKGKVREGYEDAANPLPAEAAK